MAYLSITEAIHAFLNKQEVEYSSKMHTSWLTLESDSPIGLLNTPNLKFRLKPEIVTVSLTYAIPLPFTPKEGEEYWCIDPRAAGGYTFTYYYNTPLHNSRTMLGVYRTEAEVAVALANQQHAVANLL